MIIIEIIIVYVPNDDTGVISLITVANNRTISGMIREKQMKNNDIECGLHAGIT